MPPRINLPLRKAMPQSMHPLIEARRDQMFPVLEPAEIGRLWRFAQGGRVSASVGSVEL
jgi:hypothetical protein